MRAVLEDAILCIAGRAAPAAQRDRLATEARAWVASHDRRWVFAFESLCDALGLDPDALRSRLLRGDAPALLPALGETVAAVRAGRRRGNPCPVPPTLRARAA